MEHGFLLGIYCPEKRTTFPDVPLLSEISRWNDPKFVFHLLFNWILKKILVNGKQPYIQHYILLVEAIYI